jgi:peptidyl-prolyl cis-trans isomerase D
MLKTMRKMTKPIMWFVAIIFVAFLGWQGVFTGPNTGNTIALINGEDISFQVYDAFYQRSYRLAQQEYGDTVEFDQYIEEQIKNRTWEDLVTQVLLTQEAKKRGVVVTDKEIFEYLRRFPPFEVLDLEAFSTEGKFDYNKYAQALVDPRLSQAWLPVESYVRERLLIAKLQMTVTSLVRVNPDEVKQQWLKDNSTLDVKFVRFPVERYQAAIQYTPQELEQFYEKNKQRFPKEERAELYYVEFLKKPQPSDELETKKKLEEIKAQIKTEADFSKMAQQYSEDQATKDNGGDLGWVQAGSFIPAFDEVLRKLQPLEISEPLRSNYGWHLLKLHQKSVSGPEQFHVSHILIKPKLSEKGLKELKEKVNQFYREARPSDLEKAAAKLKYSLVQTGWFNKGGFIQGLGNNAAAQKFAFGAKPGQVSEIIETPNGYYVLQLRDYLPTGPATYDEIKAQLALEYKRVKALERCAEEAEQFYQLIQKSQNLTQTAKSLKETVSSTGKFKAAEPLIPQVGGIPEFTQAALKLSKTGQVSPPVKTPTAVFLLELASRETPADSLYAAMEDSLYQTALQQKQSQIYSLWFTQLRGNAKIEDFRKEFLREEEPPSEG